MRYGKIERKTAETNISLELNIDGAGVSGVNTGSGFLDHMLTLFAKHARFDLNVKCAGDTNVDYHHTAEDVGICLGKAFFEAIGDKKGINRYGGEILPMDEALVLSAADISGRGFLVYNLEIPSEKIGDFDTELIEEFWRAFAHNAGITLHITKLNGNNSHHIAECAFKSVARSLKTAVAVERGFESDIPSTKGAL